MRRNVTGPRPRRGARWRTAVRRLAAVTAAATVAATTATAGGAAAETTGRDRTVTAGNARFQVLSPTLIRTEYADDGRFVDKPTFNVIGRDAFPRPKFTATQADGWLTIKTSALTLRYRLGSGPFGPENLTVSLTAGRTPVTATPWRRVVCDVGALCEAESQSQAGLAVATDHAGYTGTGFLAGFEAVGDTLTAEVTVGTAGTYRFAVRYANAVGGDGRHTTRTLSLTVDGGAARTITLPTTPDWDTWAVATADLELDAGRHLIALTRTADDSGHVNVDSVALTPPDAEYPPVSATAIASCRYGTSCEAESGRVTGSGKIAADHKGFAGTGFVAELHQGASLTTRVTDVPADGTYLLHVRYANGTGADGRHQDRTATVTVGDDTREITFPKTDDWSTWRTVSVPVPLKAGTNEITLGCPEAASCHVNPDTIAVTAAGAAAPPPHLALGGYRRSLDGVDGDRGDPPATPGLLHRDGWYLLDDTHSALFDPSRGTVTPRPGHGGRPYQDGYVFGYGLDYKRGLSELATLTGPPALLPQWAYGVWFSQYFDRTDEDFRTLVARFRAEGVPLDVLVVDTDFKAPNTWSGWQIDRAKFPDPKAFFAWARSQGLHTVLNIHPSILGDDPKFARAQQTAKGRLQRGGCPAGPDCHVFDWGDPDQLKAYLDLHAEMEEQGTDFWWLDWCCDASRSSLAGVTPDAWINHHYARRADRLIGRGFVLSRAYGSLQSGPYAGPAGPPTGPWAEKRTTVHFTGDSTGSWGTLRYAVGATPAESAATGTAAISHDIGGHNDPGNLRGSERYKVGDEIRYTTRLPDDLYARWVQLGTFQPIDRLHSNHGDRLPWQYGPAANASAKRFLNLRERLVPYTYTLAREAHATGVPIVRPMYLEYPDEEQAYATADTQYLYGPDLLVAPVTRPGEQASVTVWFPPGAEWTDIFTGRTYPGGTTHTVTSTLDTMPVFLKSGGILVTRTGDVANHARHPLTEVTVTVGLGSPGSFTLQEDDGAPAGRLKSLTTRIDYTRTGPVHRVRIGPAKGAYRGQATAREWTLSLRNAAPPSAVTVDGAALRPGSYTYDAASRTLTVTLPRRPVHQPVTVTVR